MGKPADLLPKPLGMYRDYGDGGALRTLAQPLDIPTIDMEKAR